ncbi:unnamed protein product [Moneuplotes crassus]|uniref:Aminotransferase class I/classII large domain-containing protein n=1 Tax=Euplotes crassus TaxID=5936 RepID=A0AAD1UCX1_EUPCR|nr:unnamed protein product [Moneuplotes crassus]
MLSRISIKYFSRTYKASLNKDTIPSSIIRSEYAVRGAIAEKALKMQRQMEDEVKFPFEKIIQLNIGNPQNLGQKPISFNREVLASCLTNDIEGSRMIFSSDAVDRAEYYLSHFKHRAIGAYTDIQGVRCIMREVKSFIEKRDGVNVDENNIFLTNGATEGITFMLNLLIKDENDGIMIPIPQYPMYSALITKFEGTQVPYYLDESKGWGMSFEELERSYAEATDKGINVRSMVVINPGNPTGQVLAQEDLNRVIQFAHDKQIFLLADEVYQRNIYVDKEFCSVRKAIKELGSPYDNDVELASFHSLSKGLHGECGLRGGFLELHNIDSVVNLAIYKFKAVASCGNIIGQIGVGLMANPPTKDTVSKEVFDLYQTQEQHIHDGLKYRANLITEKLNSIQGITCNEIEGAMYAFPQIKLPQSYCDLAHQEGLSPDLKYCLEILDKTGIMIVPGSGFGQEEGTYHFRITNLVDSKSEMIKALDRIGEFTSDLMSLYK